MTNKNKKRPAQKSYNPQLDRSITYVLITLFVVFLALFTTSKLTNEDDYFWHFATGRYIVENHTIPSADVFSFPTLGQRWLVTEWLWDILSYTIFKFTGYAGISIFTTLIFFIIAYISIRLLRKFKVSYTIIIPFLTLFFFGAFERLTPRPHIISYLFFFLLLSALINFKYFNRSKKITLYLLPVMFMIWANMHMGCVIGIFIMGLFLVTEIITYFKPARFSTKEVKPLTRSELVTLGMVFLASILAMLVNPHGIMTYIYAASSQIYMQMLQQAIREWISPFDPSAVGQFQTIIYIIFLITGLVILYYSYRKKDLFAAVLYLIFAINSTRAIRFTVDFQVVILIYFIVSADFVIHKIKNVSLRNLILSGPAVKMIFSIILLFFVFTIPNDRLYITYLQYARFFGFGIDKAYYPEAMFKFIKDKKIDELVQKPFNTFECGGYYIWNFPGKLNFFDGRDLNDFIMNEYQVIYSKLPGYENKIKNYNFDIAICVVPDILTEPGIMKQNVMSYFCTHTDEWKMVFWNDRSLMFVRNDPRFADIISKYEYKYVTPYNYFFQKFIMDKGVKEDREQFVYELYRKHDEEPASFFLNMIAKAYAEKMRK